MYVASREAARLCNYTTDYIGQLCRGGHINATRVGRMWYVDKESLLSYKQKVLLQNKQDFQTSRPSENIPLRDSSEETSDTDQVLGVEEHISFENRSTHYHKTDPHQDDKVVDQHSCAMPQFADYSHVALSDIDTGHKRAFAISLAIVLFIFFNAAYILRHSIPVPSVASIGSIASGIGDTILDGAQYVRDGVYDLAHRLRYVFARNSGGTTLQEPTTDTPELPPVRTGLVVAPSLKNPSAQIEEIKNSFSDEVIVSVDESKTSGFIRPVFRSGKSENYIYVLVPVKE